MADEILAYIPLNTIVCHLGMRVFGQKWASAI